MRVLVCGSRYWTDEATIRRTLSTLLAGSVVIHGACGHYDRVRRVYRGADVIAGRVATELGFEVEAYPADWSQYGKAAGPIRNQQMLDEGKPDEVWAFHEDLSKSRGTRDMLNRARRAGIPTSLFSTSDRQVWTHRL